MLPLYFQVDGSYLCPNCNFPLCEEMCAFGEEHSSKECLIFSQLEDRIQITDYSESNPIYWSITVLRILMLKESDPKKYEVLLRMMDHNEEHR